MTKNVSRADLVAQYNSMSLALGRGVVKDFRSKWVAEQRIAAIKPDFEAYLRDLEAKNVSASTPSPSLAQPATVQEYVNALPNNAPGDAWTPNDERTPVGQPAPIIEMVDIVLHNNDNTAQWDVTQVLSAVFGLSIYGDHGGDGPAYTVMMEANDKGKAVVGTYPRSQAEDLMQKVAAEIERIAEKRDFRWQYVKELKFTIEPASAKEQAAQ